MPRSTTTASLLLLAAATTTTVTSSTKRGMAEYAGGGVAAPLLCGDLNLIGSSISWMYSWGLTPANTTCPQIQSGGSIHFEPMVWGAKDVGQPAFTSSATHLLTFNEPNNKGQSDLTPQQAAKLWPQVAATAKAAGLQLVAPVPSGADTAWLKQFFQACGCEKDVVAVALHPYVSTGKALKNALDTWSTFGKPLHVLEFNNGNGGKNASAAEQLAYMQEALPVLEADSRVVRYAWMSARDAGVPGAALFQPVPAGADGKSAVSVLTALGKFYFGYNYTADEAALLEGESVKVGTDATHRV
jgi:hypothetical protein